jgi:DNA-binding transcriptional regulator YhcF (GntR family)
VSETDQGQTAPRATGAIVNPEDIPPERRKERARQALRMAVIEAQRAGISREDVEMAVLPIDTEE